MVTKIFCFLPEVPTVDKQWGITGEVQPVKCNVTLPITYRISQFAASVTDWGASGKAYGIIPTNSNLQIVAPAPPFNAFWISIGC